MPDFLTKAEVARMLRVNPRTIDNWVRAGKFPAPVRMSPWSVRFLLSDVKKALEERGLSPNTSDPISGQ